MANGLYAKGREGILDRTIDMTAATIKCFLVDTAAYTANLATDQFLSAIPVGNRIGTAQALASKTYTGGVFDAADITFSGLSSPPTVEGLVILNDTGTDTTSRLVAWFDTATGLPTSGASVTSVTVTWDNGANRIFAL